MEIFSTSIASTIQIIFTLSNEQAAVKRGFSVNEYMLVENLQQKSLGSRRIIYDYIKVGQKIEVEDYNVPRELVLSCYGAHAKYLAALEQSTDCSKVLIVFSHYFDN